MMPQMIDTDLLPSFSRAIAMRSLVLRNISITRMTASATERAITAKQTRKNESAWIKMGVKHRQQVLKWPRTEDEPRLAELQVDAEVCVEADVRDGDVGARLPTQAPVLPETVPDACRTDAATERRQTCLPLLWQLDCSGDCGDCGGGAGSHRSQ